MERPPEPSALVEVAAARSVREIRARALVLFAMDIPHEVVQGQGGARLLVPAEYREHALQQLSLYQGEERVYRRRSAEPRTLSSGAGGAVAYAALLVICFGLQVNEAGGLDWRDAGISRADSIRLGEIWRAMTSLSLHADITHLLSNVFFGALFGVLLTQMVGSGVGWLAILLSGWAGNALNALAQPALHASLGASTAVFGALGLMVGYEWRRRTRASLGHIRRWAPPLLGSFLLAWLGFGGGNTDVLAHVLGFLSGALLSLLLGSLDARVDLARPRLQRAAACAALGLFSAAWVLAFAA